MQPAFAAVLLAALLSGAAAIAPIMKPVVVGASVDELAVARAESHVFLQVVAAKCPLCQVLGYSMAESAAYFRNHPEMTVMRVNITEEPEFKELLGITSTNELPGFRLFRIGQDEPHTYRGNNRATDVAKWVAGIARIPITDSRVVVLNRANFYSVVYSPKRHTLVHFYTKWCYHCKKLVPILNEVADTFHGEATVVVARIDCQQFGEFCKKMGVTAYPSLRYIKPMSNKDNIGDDYAGDRTAEGLVDYLNGLAETHRVLGGGLNELAGRVDELDHMVYGWAKFPAKKQQETLDAIRRMLPELAAEDKEDAEAYALLMDGALRSHLGPGIFLATERSRMESKLEAAPNAQAENYGFYKRRANMLAVLVPGEAGGAHGPGPAARPSGHGGEL